MKTYPKISIVTPSYNQGKYIEQAINSVLDQNYPNLEYIIIDGGSADETIDIIMKYEKQITYWVSEPDKGQTDAINKGFKKCTGEIFNWLNSDDYYAPKALHIVGEAFLQDQLAKVVCGKEYGFYEGEPERKIIHNGSVIKDTVEETIFTGIIDQPCTFFKRKDIEAFFPLNESLRYVMDRELWWHFLGKYGIGEIKQIDDVLTFFRLHSTSKSVKEGSAFEAEFALLKLELLQKIQAPQWLRDDMYQQAGENMSYVSSLNSLELKSVNTDKLLSVFAYDFAVRSYVKDDVNNARIAIQFVKQCGGLKKEYLPLFIKAVLLPPALIKSVKQFKKSLSWKN